MLFAHEPQKNPVSQLHPLVKIAMLGTTAVFAFLVSDIGVLAGFCLGVLVLIRIFRVRFGRALILVKLYLFGAPLLLGLFVLSYLWQADGLRAGALLGLAEGARYLLRFLGLILVNYLVVLSTDPRELFYALRVLKLPAVVSQIMAHVITLFPRMMQELQAVVEAQTLRGMRLRGLWRPSSWMHLVLPVILASMRHSEQAAITLELRGGLDSPRHNHYRFRAADWVVSVVCGIVITGAVLGFHLPVA